MKKGVMILILLLCVAGAAKAEIEVSEVLCANGVYENGEAYPWAEVHNPGGEAESLAGVRLVYTRNEETFAYTFPEGTWLPSGGYAAVTFIGCDPEPRQPGYYAPFEISKKGGEIRLERDGGLLCALAYPEGYANISYGLASDGQYRLLETPTKGAANAGAGYDRRAGAPEFSMAGGLYEGEITVALTGAEGAQIRFTLDGHEPTAQSPLYTKPLPLHEITTLRARAFEEGALPSETVTQTYLIGVSSASPVVSLVTDEKYLFDSKTGLLVPGSGKTKNYERDWEYPVSVEYYDGAGVQRINQTATFRVTGATSKKYGQKTLSLFARAAYGEKTFSFNPFSNREDCESYKSLTLRAAGTESFMTRFRDAMLASRAAGLGILYQEAVPVTVYINGEYWGHYNLREKVNKHMIAQFEGIEDKALIDTMTIIKGRGEVQMGSAEEWKELIQFCKKKDLNEPENLNWLAERLDIDNYFTHTAIEMIIGNADIGNVRYYKIPGGKWKCALYDLDAGMENLDRGPIRYYSKTPAEDSQLFYHEPFAALIRVPQMRARFLEIFGQAILRYLPADLDREIDRWVSALEPLMADQIARWPKCSPDSVGVWNYEVKALRKICAQRPKKAVEMLVSTYKVTNEEEQKYFSDFYAAIGR